MGFFHPSRNDEVLIEQGEHAGRIGKITDIKSGLLRSTVAVEVKVPTILGSRTERTMLDAKDVKKYR